MFQALASSPFLSGRPRWVLCHRSGFCQAAPWPGPGTSWDTEWPLLGSVPGQRVKTRGFQGRPGKSHPAAAPCPRVTLAGGFLRQETESTCPGSCRHRAARERPSVEGTPELCPRAQGTPGVLGSGLAVGEPPGCRVLTHRGRGTPGIWLSEGKRLRFPNTERNLWGWGAHPGMGEPLGRGVCPVTGDPSRPRSGSPRCSRPVSL